MCIHVACGWFADGRWMVGGWSTGRPAGVQSAEYHKLRSFALKPLGALIPAKASHSVVLGKPAIVAEKCYMEHPGKSAFLDPSLGEVVISRRIESLQSSR